MRARVRCALAGAVVTLAAIGWPGLSPESAAQGPQQPILFSHKIHAGDFGMNCQYCHADARRSPYAGIPSVKRCMGCHQITAAQKPEVQKLQQYWKDGRAIPWVRLHKLPGYVYFPHKRHVAKAIECEKCHGPVKTMTLVTQHSPLTMGWCVECHAERKAPLDCVACHH